VFLTALVAPVGTAILTSLETSAAVQVAPAAANRLIGAEYPLLIDTNGDGRPSEGVDQGIGLTQTGATLAVQSPWDCNPADDDNEANLVDTNSDGKYDRITRRSDRGLETLNVIPDGQGRISQITYVEGNRQGSGAPVDANGDGVIDGLHVQYVLVSTITPPPTVVQTSLVQTDVTGDGQPDYVSVPWSQASALGVDTGDGCGPDGADPQIWVPLADTNGDGTPDGIAFDLDGNGVADPGFFGTAAPIARPSGSNRYVGPNFPIVIDTDGDGEPSAADTPITLERAGARIVVRSPWDGNGGDSDNVIELDQLASGKYTGGSRQSDRGVQRLDITGFAGGGANQVRFQGPEGEGTGGLRDQNDDGVFDVLTGGRPGGPAFAFSLVKADADDDGHADYVSVPWSQASLLGVDKGDGVGPGTGGTDPQIWVPLADTDSDGVPDSVVFDLNGDGIPDPDLQSGPALSGGTFSVSTAEGATNSFFESYVLLANPHQTPVAVVVHYQSADGVERQQALTLAAASRTTLRDGDLPGLSPNASGFRLDVPSGLAIGVERAMYFQPDTFQGGHVVGAVEAPATRWYFAEGSQIGFETFYLFTNQGASDATLTLTFLTEDGTSVAAQTMTVPAGSRRDFAAQTVPALAGKSFGVVVDATQPVVAARSMLFGQPPFQASHASSGTPYPSTTWLHADAQAGTGADTFVLLANPNQEATVATVTVTAASGAPVVRAVQVPGRSRRTFWLNPEAPGLTGAVMVRVEATRPIVSERSVYSPSPSTAWLEGHSSMGVADAAPRWLFAEGFSGGAVGFETTIAIANPSLAQASNVRLTFLPDAGPVFVRDLVVPASRRGEVRVSTTVPELAGRPYSVLVETTNGVPVTTERTMTWTGAGVPLAGGSSETAMRLP
jgi:hypothetical protein